jgi:hypothetical protein
VVGVGTVGNKNVTIGEYAGINIHGSSNVTFGVFGRKWGFWIE